VCACIFKGTITRPSRPSPNAAPVEIVPTSDIPTTLSDVNYDQLEAILIEKIQTYLQTGRPSFSEQFSISIFISNEIGFRTLS